MPTTHTTRTLSALRKEGWLPDVVEKWIPQARRRKDLYGFIDVLAVGEGGVLGVQACAYCDVSKRVKKIEEHENVGAVRKGGIAIQVWGWRKVKNRWQARVVDVS